MIQFLSFKIKCILKKVILKYLETQKVFQSKLKHFSNTKKPSNTIRFTIFSYFSRFHIFNQHMHDVLIFNQSCNSLKINRTFQEPFSVLNYP